MAIQITQGTQTNIYTKLNAGTEIGVVKLDIGSGTAISDFGGTLLALNNLAAGTVTALSKGTVSTGTVDSISQLPPNSWGTTISTGGTGGSNLGTIKAAVAGSQIFVTDLIISAGTVTTLVIGNGGTSTPLVGTLSFATNGGLVSNFRTPLATTAGSALTYQQSVANTLTITAYGFVR